MKYARLLVDLGALRANYRLLTLHAERVGAVLKANAYGLGAVAVLQALRIEGCADFFVATVDEGLELREADRGVRIYVFSGPADDDEASALAEAGLTPVLNDPAQAARWRAHRHRPVAVMADTGMKRLGFAWDELHPGLLPDLDVRLVMSHLASADDPSQAMNKIQPARFDQALRRFPGAHASIANSAGTLCGLGYDLARPGIALYGGNPFTTRPNPMRPVATLQARVLALRDAGFGETVGYGGDHLCSDPTHIAVLGIGYADGLPRQLRGASFAYQDTRLNVIGRLSMDMITLDATPVAGQIAVGDSVEVFGATVPVDETASKAGTISYDLLTGLGRRVPRSYQN